MKHPRTLIREAVAALLSANLPKVDARITPARISIHRSTPLFAGKLPAILIYTRDERIEEQPNADPGLRPGGDDPDHGRGDGQERTDLQDDVRVHQQKPDVLRPRPGDRHHPRKAREGRDPGDDQTDERRH